MTEIKNIGQTIELLQEERQQSNDSSADSSSFSNRISNSQQFIASQNLILLPVLPEAPHPNMAKSSSYHYFNQTRGTKTSIC